ncbi:MAG TPA: tRNA 2-thiocytidine(32) synthetase TtcA [Candidatus Fimimonas merdipullorum]|uniref:tRNA 2-thiocytidine(32) synthetase TtcA n=1 Tax=Candidatus Fimimonas merdipullorum TaxID=2840822 RepID=A0A9D1MXC8_9BACT|nr:tRNA 2-thiocytidine(32) synthetase TtcA [Candidatus Fimimonas merdipullorum]
MIQKLLSLMRRAINDFDMIHSGDKIAVGVSGGKDSLALLQLLCAYQKFSEHAFELCAVTVDMGFADSDFSPVERFCEELGVNYRREKTDIAEIIFDVRKEKNPCSLCAKMRRGALNSVINEMGYNKLALGHHKNDVVDTFMLSLMFEGRLSTFQPVSYMSRSDVTLIRPLVYVSEREIAGLAKTLPVCKNPCPADKRSQREEMKKLLKDVAVKYPDVSDRIANAVMHPDRYNLWGMNKKQ